MRPDICLVLEGTYPFVSGGVSSWVHQLVTRLSDLTFTVVHVSPGRGYYSRGPVYAMPPNVLGLEEVYLHDYRFPHHKTTPGMAEKVERFRELVGDMRKGRISAFPDFLRALEAEGAEGLDAVDLLQSRESWDVLVDVYGSEAEEESFLNFFWTWRFAYMPLFKVLEAKCPDASLFHTISTGYAGLLAAAGKLRRDRPMILTEHGIYTKERRIEINRADWIEDWDSGEVVAEHLPPYFKRYWVRQFQMMSHVCYEYADEIFTLYDGNREMQVRDGADPAKITVVPNGIDLERFSKAAEKLEEREENERFTVGFVGRVCPIKDIKTLIYAMRLVAEEVPDVRVRVLGPMDEDPEYAEECRKLVALLDLEENVHLEGPVNVVEEFPTMDVVVLTSISEAQPLVVLEAGAVGLPLVTTDVGSCSELLAGRTLEDRKLGEGGILTPIATPGATAEAVLRLYRDPALRESMGWRMRQRVNRFYDQRDMVAAYREIYGRNLARKKIEDGGPQAAETPQEETV